MSWYIFFQHFELVQRKALSKYLLLNVIIYDYKFRIYDSKIHNDICSDKFKICKSKFYRIYDFIVLSYTYLCIKVIIHM